MRLKTISCPDLINKTCFFIGEIELKSEPAKENKHMMRRTYQVPTAYVRLVEKKDKKKYNRLFECNPYNPLCMYDIDLKYESKHDRQVRLQVADNILRCGADLVSNSYVMVEKPLSARADGDNMSSVRFPYLCGKVKNGGFMLLGSEGYYTYTAKCTCHLQE